MSTPSSRELLLAVIRERDAHTVSAALGITVRALEDDHVAVEVAVSERLFQHAGIVHGGVYVLLAESAASIAAALAVDLTEVKVMGQEISASHVRSATAGVLVATARAVHRGRSTHVYAIDVVNEVDGAAHLVSTCRCTLAVRPHGG